jgi:hypothetical protein
MTCVSEIKGMVTTTQAFLVAQGMSQGMESALKVRQDADAAMEDLRTECGLGGASNMKQCLRVLLQRLSASPQVSSMAIRNEHGVSGHLLLLLLLLLPPPPPTTPLPPPI